MNLQGKNKKVALVALSAFVPNLFMVSDLHAQATANDTLKVSAVISNPLEISPSFSFRLNFNTFVIRGNGTYTIMPGGTGAITSGVTIGGQSAGTAKINIPQNVSFTMSVPTFKAGSQIKLTFAGGGVPSKEMTAASILFEGKAGISNATGTMSVGNPSLGNMKVTNPAGTGRIAIGARILFDANQAIGTYQGTYILRMTL